MSMDIIVKKGLDLKLVGKPSNEIEQAKFSQDFAVYPAGSKSDFSLNSWLLVIDIILIYDRKKNIQ